MLETSPEVGNEVGQTAGVATPERDIARDLAKRAVWVSPLFLAVGAIGWGSAGVASAAVALALVAVNFLLGAAISALIAARVCSASGRARGSPSTRCAAARANSTNAMS